MNKDRSKSSVESWVMKIDRGLTPSEEEELDRLKESDPEFSRDLQSNQNAWGFIGEHASDLPQDLLDIPQKREEGGWFGLKPKLLLGASAFASLLILCVAYFLVGGSAGVQSVIVELDSQPTTERFEDGSLARINSGSKIEYLYDDELRLIQLREGEAHFDVVSNKDKPFVVEVGGVSVRAVGTAFNVKRNAGCVDVIVTEGKVEIIALETGNRIGFLDAGQKAEIGIGDGEAEHKYLVTGDVVVEVELPWWEPLLTFSGPTLKDLAEEFSRKSGLELIVNDPDIYNIRIVGGAFSSSEPYRILDLLKESYDISWVQVDGQTIHLGKLVDE